MARAGRASVVRCMRSENGFTLIELMIVVLIIGILVAIAIPAFSSARDNAQRKACFSNERVVEGAYNRYISVESSAAIIASWSPLMTALVPSEIAREPICPGGGTYTWTNRMITCSVHGTYHDH